jgi:hypothetical protein
MACLGAPDATDHPFTSSQVAKDIVLRRKPKGKLCFLAMLIIQLKALVRIALSCTAVL